MKNHTIEAGGHKEKLRASTTEEWKPMYRDVNEVLS